MIGCFNNGFIDDSCCDVCLLKRSPFKESELVDFDPDSVIDKNPEREHSIICKFCRNSITSSKERIEINSKHHHTFTNPAGNTFDIGCFSGASGCVNVGERTMAYTWFPGFDWRYAVCLNCHSHLGWFYNSCKISFYGLILKNLAENL